MHMSYCSILRESPAIRLGIILTAVVSAGAGEMLAATGDFDEIKAGFGRLHTIAGRALIDSNGGNDWDETYEGGRAVDAELSEAHNAQADVFGNVYIADKDSHSIRVVRPDGRIWRLAGTNVAGNGDDQPQPGRSCPLASPNGLHVQPDGVCYVFDTGNRKVRRVALDGTITTVFHDPTAATLGRGLWVHPSGSPIYYSSGAEVREWKSGSGSRVFAGGFSGGLANLTVSPSGALVVTDRNAHSVYRVNPDGSRVRIAGNGLASGGGDGQLATDTGFEEVRGIAFHSGGGYFLATHRGSDLWYVDPQGKAHSFITGVRNSNPLAGEGSLASEPGNKLSEIRAISLSPGGDLIITQSDESNIRVVENTVAVATGDLAIGPDQEVGNFALTWRSEADGSFIEGSDALAAIAWTPLLDSAKPVGGGNFTWHLSSPANSGQGYFRVRPAHRWKLP